MKITKEIQKDIEKVVIYDEPYIKITERVVRIADQKELSRTWTITKVGNKYPINTCD